MEEHSNPILFHFEDVTSIPFLTTKVMDWINQVIATENHELSQLNYIFCSDSYLHQINMEYLQHDTYTDIITFPYEQSPIVESDIFISIERVRENAQAFQTTFEQELLRVIIHGVLHLCGYGDKTEEEKLAMRAKEEECLALFDVANKSE